ncbi:15453_t:CDS:1, partial [Dentiscutata erythropus]
CNSSDLMELRSKKQQQAKSSSKSNLSQDDFDNDKREEKANK